MIVNERLVTYLDSLTWQIPEPMQELEQWALQKEVPIIRRSMQSLLLFMLRLRQPKHVLEIGTAVGFSALLMRSELLPDATLDTIEKVPARIRDAKENFAKYPQGDKIRLLEGDAADILAALVREQKQYDFIFMDAAKGQYIKFFEKYKNFLNPNGTIITDNINFHGYVGQSSKLDKGNLKSLVEKIEKYIEFLKTNPEFDTKFYDIGDGLSVSTWKNE